MVRRSCCWLSRLCRSAWSWSWGPPSSCAIRLKELKWLSMPSMPTDSTLWGGGPLSPWYGVWRRCSGLELLFFPWIREMVHSVTGKHEAWRISFIPQPVSWFHVFKAHTRTTAVGSGGCTLKFCVRPCGIWRASLYRHISPFSHPKPGGFLWTRS